MAGAENNRRKAGHSSMEGNLEEEIEAIEGDAK